MSPRFAVVRGWELNEGRAGLEAPQDIAVAFERGVEALAFDADFGDVEIVECRARRVGRGHEFALIVDREGGLDVGTCERISARLSAALATFADTYELSVASAGLDRPLVRPRDYERFRDREAIVTTTLPIDHEYTHQGRLAGLRANAVILTNKRGDLAIPLEMVKSAHLVYDFRADLRRAKRAKRERGT